jgi:hypothetical protein
MPDLDEAGAATIDRRQVLKSIALVLGSSLSPSTLAGALAPSPPSGEAWRPQLLSTEQNELVTTIAELIIPATDTPGAKAARVNEFIDLMLAEWMRPAERDHFLDGLAGVDKRARKRHGAPFLSCSVEEQTEVLTVLEAKALKQAAKKRKKDEFKPFFRHMKELTLVGYYTSEIGASEELNYVIVFDEYEGCVPLEEVGAAWS